MMFRSSKGFEAVRRRERDGEVNKDMKEKDK